MRNIFDMQRVVRLLPEKLECYLVLRSHRNGKFSVGGLHFLEREAVESMNFHAITPMDFDIIFGRDLDSELTWSESVIEAIEHHQKEFEVDN